MQKAKTKNFSLPTSAASQHTTPLRAYFLSSRFICEATNHSSSRFCYEATGIVAPRSNGRGYCIAALRASRTRSRLLTAESEIGVTRDAILRFFNNQCSELLGMMCN